MAHISTMENPWGKSFTTKRYAHAPLTENIVTVWPSTMVIRVLAFGGSDFYAQTRKRFNV